MITPAFLEKKLFAEDKNDSINNNNLFRKIDLIEFSGFETVLFNQQLTNLIHCPIIAKGKYSIPLTVDTIGIESFSQCKGITTLIIPECVKRNFFISLLTFSIILFVCMVLHKLNPYVGFVFLL